jgi:hypothetical protein
MASASVSFALRVFLKAISITGVCTYGIEFLGVKPFKHVVPFYDLSKALGLQHYIAAKTPTD